MNWLSNQMMRGATNRATQRIVNECRPGIDAGALALALGYACYPSAQYGDQGVFDAIVARLSAAGTRPCESLEACSYVEQWLDYNTLTTNEVFVKVWGLSPEELLGRLSLDSSVAGSAENLTKARVLSRLYKAYDRLADEKQITAEEHQRFVTFLTNWFNTGAKEIGECEKNCIRRFIRAELDTSTPGNRGMGRMSDSVPRLGAKYRSNFSKASPEQMASCREAMEDQVLTGYLLAEYFCRLTGNDNVPKVKLDPERLLLEWVSTIFSNGVAREFEETLLKKNLGEGYQKFFRPVWLSSNVERLLEAWASVGISYSDYTGMLVQVYLDAGISLRFCQSHS